MPDHDNRITSLLSSPKIRIPEPTLRELITSEGPSQNNLLVLISDIVALENQWYLDPLFQDIAIEKSVDYPPSQIPPDLACLWEGGIPGPMIIGRFTFEQIERLIEWDEVVQIELSETIQPLPEEEPDEMP